MRVVVLGGAGMLGHQVVRRLRGAIPDTWWTLRGGADDAVLDQVPWLRGEQALERVDALDLPALVSTLDRIKPDVVVNCLGIIKQRSAAAESIPSITVNSLLPHRVAEALDKWGGRLVHFSTDCVFSGRRGNYSEEDVSDAEDLYGRSKFLGEVSYDRCVTLRTSIIGPELRHRHSLLEWFLSQHGKTVQGFTRHWWSGVTTPHLADIVYDLLQRWTRLQGLYQVSSGRINKFDLLNLLREGLRVPVTIVPDDGPFCDRSLRGDKFAEATGYVCPPWSVLIADLAGNRGAHNQMQGA